MILACFFIWMWKSCLVRAHHVGTHSCTLFLVGSFGEGGVLLHMDSQGYLIFHPISLVLSCQSWTWFKQWFFVLIFRRRFFDWEMEYTPRTSMKFVSYWIRKKEVEFALCYPCFKILIIVAFAQWKWQSFRYLLVLLLLLFSFLISCYSFPLCCKNLWKVAISKECNASVQLSPLIVGINTNNIVERRNSLLFFYSSCCLLSL